MDSATYEILLLFPTTNSFYRAEYSGMLNSVWEASQRGVLVKMLIQGTEENDKLREIVQKVIRQGNPPVSLQYIAKPLETKISTLVIDQAVSLAIEIKDDTKITFEESTGIAIYSNSESKISSSLTIFETLWIQSEIDIQNKVKQAYFQKFKGFQFKDELYTRRWSFDQQKSKRDKNIRNKKVYYHDYKTVVVASDI
jgi:two-component system, OmpR family, sensor histidine kinase VicK